MKIVKITYTVNDLGSITDSSVQRLSFENTIETSFWDRVWVDMFNEMKSNPLLVDSEDTDETIKDHLEEHLFVAPSKENIVYDGSDDLQIHYVLVE